MSGDTPSLESERAFRLNDEAIIYHRIAKPDELTESYHTTIFEEAELPQLHANLCKIDELFQSQLAELSQRTPAAATCVSLIDNKLKLIAEALCFPGATLQSKVQRISLSEIGMAFGTETQYEPNTHLCCRMYLQPHYDQLNFFASVTTSTDPSNSKSPDDPNYPFWTYIQFYNPEKVVQQKIARHILKRDAEQRKQRKTT